MPGQIIIRAKNETDTDWIEGLLKARWGAVNIVSREKVHDASRLPAFVALLHDTRVGLITYRIDENGCEIKSLDSLRAGLNIGQMLLEKVIQLARSNGLKRVWLITTNDNTKAIGYFQILGFHFSELHPGIVEKYRRMKPQIPIIGYNSIPIRDEFVLEMKLD